MNELFVPFHIPDFESIQQELLLAIDKDYSTLEKPIAFTYPEQYMKDHCPQFMSWLMPKLKLPVRIYRYYITPPKQSLAIHIDGTDPSVPFALNIPVTGTIGTKHNFYETSEDNIIKKTGPGYLAALQPKDKSKLKLVSELELVTPHVTNNSVFHGVINDTDQYRIMFTVRWLVHKTMGRNVDECIEI